MIQSARSLLLAVALVATVGTSEGRAQERQNVISANPFGLLLEVFNAEYERKVSESATAGFGGSTVFADEDDYVNADVFYRFYPSAQIFDGWAFGAKAGITKALDSGTYFGFGFDVNRSWLLGQNDNFYVGIGFGLKRLFGTPENDADFDISVLPTFRIINVGFAF